MLRVGEVERGIARTIFAGKLHVFDEVGSTNTLALEAAAEGAAEGTVFVADQQLAGRGRGGHSWHSEPGEALLFSMVLRPQWKLASHAWLGLIAALAVHSGVGEVTGITADLRWPNDLLIGTRKFCGILTEMRTDSSRTTAVVIGTGINVNQQRFPEDLEGIATSLAIAGGKRLLREVLLAAVLRAYDEEYKALQEAAGDGGPHLFARLEAISTWIRGKRVQVPEEGGYTGVTAGLDAWGFLRVETESGVRTVRSGGVRAIE